MKIQLETIQPDTPGLIRLLHNPRLNDLFYWHFHICYIYQYKEPNIALKSEQVTFSRVLEDLKNKYGNKILLIPIAGDLNLDSIDLAKSAYSVKSYPTVIVNEGKVITNIDELKEIDNLLLK